MRNYRMREILSFPMLGLQYLVSFLPLAVLYKFSWLLSWLFYNVFHYRRKIVRMNLEKSFPEKTVDELRTIEKQFYRNLTDVMVEVIKLKTMSLAQLKSRCFYTPESVQLLNRYHKEGKSIMIVMGHMGNWEWAGASYPLWNNHQVITAYRPLRNKAYDNYILEMRRRTGNIIVPMKKTPMEMIKRRHQTIATALIADQTPGMDNAFWVKFLNQDTPFYKGTEILSQKFNTPLFWGCVKRVKRGYYHIDLQPITDEPGSFEAEGTLTALHASYLERDIYEQPDSWLWSHRRWKHKLPENTAKVSYEKISVQP
ncbi:MAG: lysophospholipid acyltransferase family protein [Bacteroidales bacterium]|nr:lysophospholipid acyltransferase family protein [Bacteroidales bacterium]